MRHPQTSIRQLRMITGRLPREPWTLQFADYKKTWQVWLEHDGQKHQILLWKRSLTLSPERDSNLPESTQHTVEQMGPRTVCEPGGLHP